LENILFASKERDPNDIRLIDFGLAKVFSWSQNMHDRAGTIYTMSPEALRGDYNEKADMWSVGVCTYQILSGNRPFWADTKDEITRKVKQGRFSLIGSEWDEVSREAKSFIRCLLQFDPSLRCSPVEALKSPWLKRLTESHICRLPKERLGMLKTVLQNSTSPMDEMQKLALYAIAHKPRAEDKSKLGEIFLSMNKNARGEITLSEMKRSLEGEFTHEEIEAWFHRADIEKVGS
jgi:calcium-dependent protein kinase